MDNIIEPNKSFDFSTLSLAHPVGVQGGAYFTKIECNKKPLYIQTVKSLTRQGLIKNGKKYYCDLMFDNNSETLMHWFETLEETCRKLIFEKKNDWFQGSLEETDIESTFNSLIRIYKSGKYYLLRTYIKNNKDDNPLVKIYNENELALGINDITPETSIISILEIHGIKFTSRSFQIEVELKQIMVLNNDPTFENCLFKMNKPVHKPVHKPLESVIESNQFKLGVSTLGAINITKNNNNNLDKLDDLYDLDDVEMIPLTNDLSTNDLSTNDLSTNDLSTNDLSTNDLSTNDLKKPEKQENSVIDINFEDLMKEDNIPETNNELVELKNDLYLDKTQPAMTLKKPNQVYFELYKEARNKAKHAKKSAILAYLEAKNIKKTYMIENMNDSDEDSDFDAEIDEVSESELEGL
jgi:hypothetical protein